MGWELKRHIDTKHIFHTVKTNTVFIKINFFS